METFETIIILNPDLPEDILKYRIKIFLDTCQTFSEEKEVKIDDLGEKKLAYEIKRHVTGHYIIYTWQGTNEDVNKIERLARIYSDSILKFMTLKIDHQELKDRVKSEQHLQPDALDVLLGLADYIKIR